MTRIQRIVFVAAMLTLFEIAVGLAQNPQTQTAPIFATNAKYVNGFGPGYWPTQLAIGSQSAVTGLHINLGPGTANCGSGVIVTYASGTFTLTASTTNYIYLNTGSVCAPAVKTSAFTGSDIPIATIVTGVSSIVSVADDRTVANAPGSGSSVSWPATSDIVVSNGTNSPDGLAEVDGDCAVGVSGAWSVGSCGGGGSGPPYNPTTTAYAFNSSSQLGDDDGVLSSPITVSTWVANGTTVTINTTTAHNLTTSSYVALFDMTGWFAAPSPFNFYDTGYGSFKVASVPSSTQFTVSYTLNTGSGSGGTISNASYWGAYLPSFQAFLNGHGNPYFIISSDSRLASTDANFTALFGSITGSPKYLIMNNGQNDLGGDCVSAATIEGHLSSIWTKAHAAGFIVAESTITPGQWNTTIGCGFTAYRYLYQVNKWITTQGPGFANKSTGAYWDILIDAGSMMQDLANTSLFAPNGGFAYGGAALWSAEVNNALQNKTTTKHSSLGQLIFPQTGNGAWGMMSDDGPNSNFFDILDASQNTLFGVDTNQGYTDIYRLAAYGNFPHAIGQSGAGNLINLNEFGPNLTPCTSGTITTQGCQINDFFGQSFGTSGQTMVKTFWYGNSGLSSFYAENIYGAFGSTGFGFDAAGHFFLYGQKCSTSSCLLGIDNNGSLTPVAGGTTTNTLTAAASGGAAPGTAFNGSSSVIYDYHSFGAAPLNSPNLTGIPTAPTPTFGTNNTDIATMAAVQAAIAAAGTGAGIITYSGPSLTFSGTLYFPIGGGGLSSATETNVDIDSPAAVTIQNMTVQMSAAPGVGNSITYTWRKNAASTALTCTISGSSATSCSDTSHSFTTASLDLLDIQAVTTGTVVGTPTVVMAAQVGISTSSSGTTISLPTSGAQTAMTFDGNVPQKCPDTSGSGTAQSCSTGNAFTPTAGSCWVYTTTTTNSGTGLTVNVNSFGAKSVAVAGSSGWTTTLVASASIPANKPMTMCYDGTNMNVSGTGYAPASGGSGAWTNITGSSQITASGCTQSASTGGYCSIAGSSTAAVTFSAIPAHLRMQIIQWGAGTTGSLTYSILNFNGDSTSGHYFSNGTFQAGTSGSQANSNPTGTNCPAGFFGAGGVSQIISDIPFYADTSFPHGATSHNSEMIAASSSGNADQILTCGYTPTTAITSVTDTITAGDFAPGTKYMILVQD